jgi:hypothetical protein
MWRKIGASLLLVAAGLGLLLCLAGLIGVWWVNPPVTDALTTTIDVASGYVDLAGNTAELAGDQVGAARQELDALAGAVAAMPPEARAETVAQIREQIQSRIMPPIIALRTTIGVLRAAVVALNQSLEAANRIPGVQLPTFTDELQAADQVIDEVSNEVAGVARELADVSADGSKIAASVAAASAKLASTEVMLDDLTLRVTGIDQAMAGAEAAAPQVIDWISIALSLLFLLFGIGQASLIERAIRWLRG